MKKYKKRYYALANCSFNGCPLYNSYTGQFAGVFISRSEDYLLGKNEREPYSPFIFVEASDLVDFYTHYLSSAIFNVGNPILVDIELPNGVEADKFCFPSLKNSHSEITYYTSDTIIVKNVSIFLEDPNAMREFIDHIDVSKRRDSLLSLFNCVHRNSSLAVINQILERGNFYLFDTRFDSSDDIELYKHPEVFSVLWGKWNEDCDEHEELLFPEDTTASGVDSGLSQAEQDALRILRFLQHRREDTSRFVLGKIQPGRGARGTYLDVGNAMMNALHDVPTRVLEIQETDTLFQTDTVNEEREER